MGSSNRQSHLNNPCTALAISTSNACKAPASPASMSIPAFVICPGVCSSRYKKRRQFLFCASAQSQQPPQFGQSGNSLTESFIRAASLVHIRFRPKRNPNSLAPSLATFLPAVSSRAFSTSSRFLSCSARIRSSTVPFPFSSTVRPALSIKTR